ncbi:MAG TPA: arylsulfatase [Haliscomenobacter sp.]|mgnify:CR=1 FL=1|uniref:arylsulfatase n=1 Tax=Haliscomenobacter sp. TaxID=2717303 RepID=UPI002BD6A283|nr:arylsulfatase [Haliscomenobacter sp.]HOY16243.1 arylsulfatase [Haliscomenobacter sp.]
MHLRPSILAFLLLTLSLLSTSSEFFAPNTPPNIVLIMVDDMGWSDIGPYGGEIPTPNLDRLAKNGLRFKQFYNTGRCCPTRATLLTGLYPHQTGIGHMAEDPEKPDQHQWGTYGYQGFLNRNCVTIAEALKTRDYHTYMVGKWHVGMHGAEKRPLQRGFEHYYGHLAGATSYFKPQGGRGLWADNQKLDPPSDPNYYTTDAFTDQALRFLQEQKDDKPFFLYMAYNAPHWPLHAKPADIAKFKDSYHHGWDAVRQNRLNKQVKMGLVDPKWALSARDKRVRTWDQLSLKEQDSVAYRMAVYAAQVYAVDANIGKLLRHLEQKRQMDNTLILFLSDNGACAENYHELGSQPFHRINDPNYSGSVSYGIGWANASNTPFFEYKVKPYEGGIATPLIAHYPRLIKSQRGKFSAQVAHLIDIMPTLLQLSGTSYPSTFHQGMPIQKLEGLSLVDNLKTGKVQSRPYLFWEHQGYCAIRKGDFKAVKSLEDSTWQLYDLKKDRTEQQDLAGQLPGMVQELDEKWNEWATTHHVLPKRN